MSYPQVIHNFGKLKLGCNELKLGCNELKLGCNELKLGCNLPIFKSASVLGVDAGLWSWRNFRNVYSNLSTINI